MEARPKLKIKLTPGGKLFKTIGWLTLIILWTLALFNLGLIFIPMTFFLIQSFKTRQ
jgi:hypothetical protein